MTFGQWIKARRIEAGWSQNELAKVARVGQPTISRLESGEQSNPCLLTVRALCRALGVTYEVD